jgi:type VI secretion system secreted protein Hcp
MAVDMFIKIDTVDGEAHDSKHKKEIDVLSWSWGMSNNGSAHVGAGAGSGKVNVQDLTFTKRVDTATPKLALACCAGKHFKEAVLVVRKAGNKPVEYLKIKMDVVLISAISTGGSGETNGEIATILGNSESTVKKHVLEIFEKLGVETRTAAGLRALEVLSSPAARG